MKPLPKEFQFKYDEHSLEQCKKLGIDKGNYIVMSNGLYYVKDNVIDFWDYDYRQEKIPLISLADYIESEEEEIERLLNEAIVSMPKEKFNKIVQKVNAMTVKEQPDHSDLIVELTGKYVAAMFSKPTKLPTDELPISVAIIYAEETVKQLKERGYLK
jgi:hypothetical protein